MFAKLIRKLTATGTTEFCDSCAQVCTPQCRSAAIVEKTRTQNIYQLPIIH
jgi:hypothetical protein